MKQNKPDRLTTAIMAKREKTATCPALMKQVTCRAITEKTAATAKQVMYQTATAKQAMYQMATVAPATCPVPTAKRLFPAMTLPYTVRRQPQPAPLQWKEAVEAILMMRQMTSSQ